MNSTREVNINSSLLIISIGRVIQILLSIVVIKVSTTYLGSSEMGVFYLLTSLLSYFGLTLIGPIGNYINRNVHKWRSEGKVFENFLKYNAYLIGISILSIPIVYICTKYLGILTNLNTLHLILVIGFGIYFTTLNTFFAPTLNLFNFRISFVVFSNLTLLFNIIFSILLINLFETSGLWWFSGQILSQILFTLISGVYFFSKIKEERSPTKVFSFNKNDIKPVLSFTLPLAIATFFLWATNESYRFIIERFLSLEYLGFLAVGIAISTKVSTAVETLLHQLLHPAFFDSINTHDQNIRELAWNSFFRASLPSYISVTIFMAFLSPFLIRILSGEEFYNAWVFLIFGAVLNLIRMITNHVALIAHTEYKTKSLIIPGFISAISSVGLVQLNVFNDAYFYLVPISLIAGAFLGMISMIFQMNKILKISIKVGDIFIPIIFGSIYYLATLFYGQNSDLLFSIGITAAFGVYFILTQLFFFKRNKVLGP
ncbi:oligosaccharide flippase family protein [Halobacteriovorax sp. JY17]|uniref:lipopolysaccharide biosynthesis protein n=1 Tax=Halobacteriovorax sp. JY17 TaxID=2014617 RepID=UPI0025BD844F|nr:oligosaccharide flippase family protein [Halobacteriovorax sp. JY17]